MDASAAIIRCAECGQTYPRLGTIPVLLADAENWIALWRVQLEVVERQAQQQFKQGICDARRHDQQLSPHGRQIRRQVLR